MWTGASPGWAQSFTEDFEGDLSQWVGEDGDAHHGEIVDDPLRPGNRVVRFWDTTGGGDIFGPEVSVGSGQSVLFSFEYLGLAEDGSIPDDFGGFIGYALDLHPNTDCSQSQDPNNWDNVWIAGTEEDYCNLEAHLIDDGDWHYYELQITPVFSPMRVIVEDYRGPVAGDAYFDNISVTVVGCPGDIDGDCDVDLSDLAALLGAFGHCVGEPEYNPDADFDGNGCVDLADLAELLAHYSEGT
jgi:chitinase